MTYAEIVQAARNIVHEHIPCTGGIAHGLRDHSAKCDGLTLDITNAIAAAAAGSVLRHQERAMPEQKMTSNAGLFASHKILCPGCLDYIKQIGQLRGALQFRLQVRAADEIERLRQKSEDDDDEIMALKTALKNLQPMER